MSMGSGKVSGAKYEHRVSTTSAIEIPAFYIEQVLPHQPPVHSAVGPLVENRIVDVPIGIVVGPAGREALPNVEF